MMNAKKAAWIAVTIALCMAIVAMLRSCVFVRTITSQARLQRLLASLPEPESVVLLDEAAGVGGGSDSGCYIAYVHGLYGSDQSPEDVLGFFRDALLSGGKWEEIDQHSPGGKLTL